MIETHISVVAFYACSVKFQAGRKFDNDGMSGDTPDIERKRQEAEQGAVLDGQAGRPAGTLNQGTFAAEFQNR